MSEHNDKVKALAQLLKSTPLPQGTRRLHNTPNSRDGKPGYCCLGVMCLAVGYTDEDLGSMAMPSALMVQRIAERFGLDLDSLADPDVLGDAGVDPQTLANRFAYLNDEAGYTFAEIGEWVEDHFLESTEEETHV